MFTVLVAPNIANGKPQPQMPVVTAIQVVPSNGNVVITIKDPLGVSGYDIYSSDSLDGTWTICATNVPVSGTGFTQWKDTRPKAEKRFYKIAIHSSPAMTAPVGPQISSRLQENVNNNG